MSNANFAGLKPLAGSLDYSELPASGGQDKYNRVIRESQKTRTLLDTIKSNTLTAGSGLTGGGNYGSGNIQISLGTPSTLVAGNSPLPSGGTHSHGFITPTQTEATNGTEDTKIATPLSVSWTVTGRIATNTQSVVGEVNNRVLSPSGNALYVNNRLATSAQATTGTNNTNLMTTGKVVEYLDANIATEQEVLLANNNTKFVLEKDADKLLSSNIDSVSEESRDRVLRYARGVVNRAIVKSLPMNVAVAFTTRTPSDLIWVGEMGKYVMTTIPLSDQAIHIIDGVTGEVSSPTQSISGVVGVEWSPTRGIAVLLHSNGISTSVDFETWTHRADIKLSKVVWAEALGLFVAMGVDGTYTSVNGISWNMVNSSSYPNIKELIWCDEIGTLIAISVGSPTTSVYLRSINGGVTWTPVATPHIVNDVTYMPDRNRLVSAIEQTLGNIAVYQYSDNGGVTWSTVTSPTPYTMKYKAIEWSPELGVLRAATGQTEIVYIDGPLGPVPSRSSPYSISEDGVNWKHYTYHLPGSDDTGEYSSSIVKMVWNEDYGVFCEAGAKYDPTSLTTRITSCTSPDWIPSSI